MSKALLIQSYTTLTTGIQGDWNELNMANSYIQGIQTGDILGNVNAQTLSALISGVPSPWARARPAPRNGAARAEPASRRSTASRSGASAAARQGSRRRATGTAASSPSAAVRRGAAACRNTIRRAFRRESRSARRRPRGGSRGRGGRRAANRTPVRGTSVRLPCLRP